MVAGRRRAFAPGFPGKLAGASLKPAFPRHCPSLLDGFPRQTCRGLIEARASRDASSIQTSFPGKLAGASLKLGVLPAEVEDRARFPGKLAGASLKHQDLPPRGHQALRVSPANLPGPH